MTEVKHGTLHAYNYHKCRCEDCRAKANEYMRAWRKQAKTAPPLRGHGKRSTYCNYGCRCEPCMEEARRYNRERYARRKAGAA